MQEFPHTYSVKAEGTPPDTLTLSATNLPTVDIAAPAQFGGPGDQWSPEDLLIASIATCLVLSFRAIARASRLEWTSLECVSEGKLERIERVTQFTSFTNRVRLVIPSAEHQDKAERLVNKAEETCLITNSLRGESELILEIVVAG